MVHLCSNKLITITVWLPNVTWLNLSPIFQDVINLFLLFCTSWSLCHKEWRLSLLLGGFFPTYRKTQRKGFSLPINVSPLNHHHHHPKSKQTKSTLWEILSYMWNHIKKYIKKISSIYEIHIYQRTKLLHALSFLLRIIYFSIKKMCKAFLICTGSAKHRDKHESDNEISISKYALLDACSEGSITT